MIEKQINITLYLMNQKGLLTLSRFLERFGSSYLSRVIAARDPNVAVDYYDEIKQLCFENNVNFIDRLEEVEAPNVGNGYSFAIGWRWLIHTPTKLIVFHDSCLPSYRGFAPVVSALINQEKEIGVTALWASENYDEGEIIAQKSVSIEYPLKIQEAINKIAPLYGELICSLTENLLLGKSLPATPQDASLATYSLWRDEQDYQINWEDSATHIVNFINAVGFPYKGASSYITGAKVRILDAEICEDVIIENRSPGKVIFIKKGLPIVVCGQGLLKLIQVVDDTTQENILPLKHFRTRFGSL